MLVFAGSVGSVLYMYQIKALISLLLAFLAVVISIIRAVALILTPYFFYSLGWQLGLTILTTSLLSFFIIDANKLVAASEHLIKEVRKEIEEKKL
jgi:VIT1/CCC1 family predicted Fe2+/Mn2+ transporter